MAIASGSAPRKMPPSASASPPHTTAACRRSGAGSDDLSDLDVPILMDFPAGHEVPNLTLPLGTDVELVADETTGWIVYREDALTVAESPSTSVSPAVPAV